MSQTTLDCDYSSLSSPASERAPYLKLISSNRNPSVAHPSQRPRAPFSRANDRISVLLGDERTLIGECLTALLQARGNLAVVGHAPNYADVTTLAEKLRPSVVIVSFSMAIKHGIGTVRQMLHNLCGATVLVLIPRTSDASGSLPAVGGCLTEYSDARALEKAVREAHEGQSSTSTLFRPRRLTWSAAHTGDDSAPADGALTAREWEILRLIAQGNANKQTAATLGISIKTVEKHRQNLMDKLHIHETAGLTRYALCVGMAG